MSLFYLLVFTCHTAYPWWDTPRDSDYGPYHPLSEPTCKFKSYEDPGLADAAHLSDEKALRLLLSVSIATTKNPAIDGALYQQMKFDLTKYSPAGKSSLSLANALYAAAPYTSTVGLVGAGLLVMTGSVKNAPTLAGWSAGGGVVAGIGSFAAGASLAASAEDYFNEAAREHAQGEVAEALKKEGAGTHLSPQFSLLADALGWNTSQRQTFIDAYINLAASQYVVPERAVAVEGKDRGFGILSLGGHSDPQFTARSQIYPREEHEVTHEDVLKLIESNALASDDQIKGIRNLNSGIAELSRIKKSSKETQDLVENHSAKSDPCAKQGSEVSGASERLSANLNWMRELNKTMGKVASDPVIHADPKASASVASLQNELNQSISEVEKLEKVAARFAKLSK